MANQEHLDILAKGVKAWNAWRAERRDVTPDLSDADFTDVDLSGADFEETNPSARARTDPPLLSKNDPGGL